MNSSDHKTTMIGLLLLVNVIATAVSVFMAKATWSDAATYLSSSSPILTAIGMYLAKDSGNNNNSNNGNNAALNV
jgi:hypothetical protein